MDHNVVSDRILYELSQVCDYHSPILPDTRSSVIERKKFMSAVASGVRYDPVFSYSRPSREVGGDLSKIEKMKFSPGLMGTILRVKAEETFLKIEFSARKSFTNDDLTDFSARLFGLPDQGTIDAARDLLGHSRPYAGAPPDGMPMSQKDLLDLVEQSLKRYGIEGWTVEPVSRANYSVAVFASDRKVRINRKAKYTRTAAERMIIHEIATHVLRSYHGTTQPFLISRYGFPGYLFTEEGAAVLNEFNHGFLSEARLRGYAGRAAAVDLALRSSFHDTFKGLSDMGFGREDAYAMTLRVKNGLADQALPGTYARDWIYLGGFLALKAGIASGGFEFSDLICYGKTSCEYLKEYIEWTRNEGYQGGPCVTDG